MEKQEGIERNLIALNPIPRVIEWDAEGAKSAIVRLVAPYKDLVVTDDNLKDMEKLQKELASMRVKVDNFRKHTRKMAMESIDAFEKEVYGILDEIAKAEDPLKDQLKKYEVERVNRASSEINKQAKGLADEIGLREEYFFEFSIKKEWTNRTAKKTAVYEAVKSIIEELKRRQDVDDDKARMKEANWQQLAILCETLSEKYSLGTPVAPSDFPVDVVEKLPQEMQAAVESKVRQRAEIELTARQQAEAAEEARRLQEEQRKAEDERRKAEEEKRKAEEEQRRQEAAATEQEMAASLGGYDGFTVVLTMRNVPKEVVEKLQNGKKLLGCEYTLEVR